MFKAFQLLRWIFGVKKKAKQDAEEASESHCSATKLEASAAAMQEFELAWGF